jgi:lysophospholipase L1-like esterase
MRTVRACSHLLLGFCVVALSAALVLAADKDTKNLARNGDAADKFPLQDGDVWVMAGDSITAQHLHSNYFEAFCYARYPKMTFHFRNSGVGGDTIPKVLARFDYDVAAWNPTVVSVELGMNDKGGFPTEQFIANMAKLTEKIQSVKARPVFFTASPVNDGSTMAKLGGNARLNDYANALKTFAEEQKAPFADQFHAVIDIWGKNKPNEMLANNLNAMRTLAKDDKVAGVEDLRKFLAAQEKNPTHAVSMKGDAVHPGEPGQLMMAAALLKELGAKGFVSSLTLDAGGKTTDATGCEVDGVKAADGKLAFDRVDQALPFPIPDEARPVLPLFPTILELSQYTLKVTGLEASMYQLQVDGKPVATLTSEELGRGVNLTRYDQGPIAAQGKDILAAVVAKEKLVGDWRGVSKTASMPGASADAKEKLADLTKKVEEADTKIREAARPHKLHFELTPVKQ